MTLGSRLAQLAASIEKRWVWALLTLVIVGLFLRTFRLDQAPASLYWEEAALGYDAYAIAQTGKDSHGNAWPLTAFVSFGDYKPALYFYTIVPFIPLFGLSAWAVRLPSALAGTSLIVAIAWLAYLLVKSNETGVAASKLSDISSTTSKAMWAAIFAAFFTTFSPWAIQFSRGGWEVNVATTLLTWGVGCWLAGTLSLTHIGKKSEQSGVFFWTAGGVILMVMSMYTYHATRVVVPIVLMLLALHRLIAANVFAEPWQKWAKRISNSPVLMQSIIMAAVFSFILAFPLVQSLRQPVVQQRFAETSLLADGRTVLLSNQYKELAGNRWWAKLLYHRWLISAWLITANSLSHFSPSFLFVSGDANLRHSTQMNGILFWFDIVWLIAGVAAVSRLKGQNKLLLIGWLAIGMLPAALTNAAPHALRILPTLPVWMLMLAFGALWVSEHKPFSKQVWLIPSIILITTLMQFTVYWKYYQQVYPAVSAREWQYGYSQVVAELNKIKLEYPTEHISFTREYGRPAMYYWFFSKTDPRAVQANDKVAERDQQEILTYDTIHFINSVNEATPGIIVSSEKGYEQLIAQKRPVKELKTIHDPQSKAMWKIYSLGE